jgi:sporulation integral membrane protein YlbJ
VLLEPVMRPLFNVPGAGSFVMMVGFFSGYPIGSMVTARLRLEGLCTRVEAERLMSFTNNSSPLFMLAAVAIGMFNNPRVGLLIAGAHYLSNLTLGLILRFYGRDDRAHSPGISQKGGNIVRHAFQRMLQVQREDNRPPGKIMGDAVRNAITSLLNIGGFIILFAVIIRLLTTAGVIDALAGLLGMLLLPLGFAPDILPALGSGFFEMTIGSKLASEAAVPLIQQVTAVGMILAWSGLSVHAQAASMIAETDISMKPFIITRLAHTALAGLYTYLACRWFALEEYTAPVTAAAGGWQGLTPYTHAKLLILFLIVLTLVIFLALLAHLTRSLRLLILRRKI